MEVRISSDKLIGKVGKDTIRMKLFARQWLHTAEFFRIQQFLGKLNNSPLYGEGSSPYSKRPTLLCIYPEQHSVEKD